ncbi:hypothetical protein VP01_1030g6 [Puccinia sorghi]|uniref:Methyltransferase type 12 domain-containing protein n=1 Tax=Puccinia sorghi TaxID=27349 RepID=A0A0L6VUZ8_9BASI|nr:hypothetical protein VP01_1030g6 [Puccinia sorghi]
MEAFDKRDSGCTRYAAQPSSTTRLTMGHPKAFTLPRGKIDEDHDASAIALNAPLPPPTTSLTTPSNPTSKVGRRQWTQDQGDPWKFNAWFVPPPGYSEDNVEWNEEQEQVALDTTSKQAANPVPDDMKGTTSSSMQRRRIFGILSTRLGRTLSSKIAHGCATNSPPCNRPSSRMSANLIMLGLSGSRSSVVASPGNTAFPILAANENPELFLYALDYSSKAVELVKVNTSPKNPLYDPTKCLGAVWDMSSADIPTEVPPCSLDAIIMIFCFSALHPKEWAQTVRNLWKMLKPGGILLFRDYGRHDLAQLRMKGSRFLEDNFYVRGDGTRVYFFDKDELAGIICQEVSDGEREEASQSQTPSGKKKPGTVESTTCLPATPSPAGLDEPPSGGHKFHVSSLFVDRRLLLNRARQLKMYRIWLQGEFRKPLQS